MPDVLLDRPPLNPSHAPVHVRDILAPVTPPRRTHKIIAVLPAYNAAKTLAATIADVPPGSVDEILLVDDGSRDGTVELARYVEFAHIVGADLIAAGVPMRGIQINKTQILHYVLQEVT